MGVTIFYLSVSVYQISLESIMVRVKGIVSIDFGGLHIILMNRTWVPDVPLEVYEYYYFSHIT